MLICSHLVIGSTVADSWDCYALAPVRVPLRRTGVTFDAWPEPNPADVRTATS
jgi:hypothetical protein